MRLSQVPSGEKAVGLLYPECGDKIFVGKHLFAEDLLLLKFIPVFVAGKVPSTFSKEVPDLRVIR